MLCSVANLIGRVPGVFLTSLFTVNGGALGVCSCLVETVVTAKNSCVLMLGKFRGVSKVHYSDLLNLSLSGYK